MMCVELSRIQRRERERERERERKGAVAARVETIRLSPFQKPRFSFAESFGGDVRKTTSIVEIVSNHQAISICRQFDPPPSP
jgi:hypothetical protein